MALDKGFGKYLTFGLRNEWLFSFLNDPHNYLSTNNLGNKQVDSLKAWLKDSGLLNTKLEHTKLCKTFIELVKPENESAIYEKFDDILIWGIIWNNLYYNSPLINFYLENFKWNSSFSKSEFETAIKSKYNEISERTIQGGINSFLNLTENSPLSSKLRFAVLEKDGNKIKKIKKIGSDEIHPKVIAYSLYKYAREKGHNNITVSELYFENVNGGPAKIFGLNKKNLELFLRWLQERDILKADLIAGLDNINLKTLNEEELIDLLFKTKNQSEM
ncbi:MAG TPA: DUF4007 family protein [Spirochaetota bacterium]|nr:DUF4007 family protein [Spirochaetota bacterium]